MNCINNNKAGCGFAHRAIFTHKQWQAIMISFFEFAMRIVFPFSDFMINYTHMSINAVSCMLCLYLWYDINRINVELGQRSGKCIVMLLFYCYLLVGHYDLSSMWRYVFETSHSRLERAQDYLYLHLEGSRKPNLARCLLRNLLHPSEKCLMFMFISIFFHSSSLIPSRTYIIRAKYGTNLYVPPLEWWPIRQPLDRFWHLSLSQTFLRHATGLPPLYWHVCHSWFVWLWMMGEKKKNHIFNYIW